MKRVLISLFSLAAIGVNAASWFVDGTLVTGADNGTSWANAWRSPTNIVWASVSAGDTVFVSGGSTVKKYVDNLEIGKDGTAGNPITVRIGQDAGHNGVAWFSNAIVHPNGSRPKWNVIDGGRNVGGTFAAPTNVAQVATGATCITNNIGFWISDRYGTNDSVTSPVAMFLRQPDNCDFKWMAITGLTNTGVLPNPTDALTRGTAVYLDQGDNTEGATNTFFRYFYLHGNMGQQFAGSTGPSGQTMDELVWEFCWLEQCGEDYWELGGGTTVRNSVVGPAYPNGVHNDFFQMTGSNIKMYNNLIYESLNAVLRIQTADGLTHDVWFFNNIMTEKRGRAVGGGTLVEPLCVVHFDPLHKTDSVTLSNIIFANNLFYNSELNTVLDPDEMRRSPLLYWDRGGADITTNAYVKAVKFVNNLVVMQHKGISFPTSTNVDADSGYDFAVNTNDVFVNFNTFSGTNRDSGTLSNVYETTYLGYMDSRTNAEFHPYKLNNVTNWPHFTDPANDNFELLSTDVYAKNAGYNMSVYFNFDALNRPRNVGGAWDKGPLESQESNLVVYLSFDGDTLGGDAINDTGYGDGKRFLRLSPYYYPSNKVYNAAGAPATTHRPTFAGRYSDTIWTNNQGAYGFYGYDGGFFGITNDAVISRLTNVNQLTVMCWARYNSAKRVDASFDSSQSGNDTLISGGSLGQGTKGSWDFGRYNQIVWLNNTRFVIQTNEGFSGGVSWGADGDAFRGYGSGNQVICNFPDNGFNDDGNTVEWYHYALTFSNGTVKTYFCGTNYGTTTLATCTNLTIGEGAARPYNWIGIGVNTHVGTPEYDNESGEDYPNNGFHNGGLDQVRIYNRALSRSEIVAIANSEGGNFTDGEVAGSPGQLRVVNLNIGTLIIGP